MSPYLMKPKPVNERVFANATGIISASSVTIGVVRKNRNRRSLLSFETVEIAKNMLDLKFEII